MRAVPEIKVAVLAAAAAVRTELGAVVLQQVYPLGACPFLLQSMTITYRSLAAAAAATTQPE
jgi:hypothetical protein